MTISMQVAREYHAEGERILAIAHEAADTKPGAMSWVAAMANLATAHFTASMSATGILLAEPAEVSVRFEQ